MTFGFRLTIIASHGEHFSSDESQVEIDLAAPIGRVTLRTSPDGVAFKDAQELIFIGQALENFEQARQAGDALKNAIRLAAADVGRAINVGNEVHRTRVGATVVEVAAQRGILILDDVHGLQVYEETGQPVVLLARTDLAVLTPLQSFLQALGARSTQAMNVSTKRALACDLFAQSRFESSQKGRHLTLVTALEILGERRERSGRAKKLVEEFRRAIRQARENANLSERQQIDSLLGSANELRFESIGTAVRRLATSIPSAELRAGTDPTDLVRESYSARSDLIHEGVTDHDLIALLDPLQELVRRLCTMWGGPFPIEDHLPEA